LTLLRGEGFCSPNLFCPPIKGKNSIPFQVKNLPFFGKDFPPSSWVGVVPVVEWRKVFPLSRLTNQSGVNPRGKRKNWLVRMESKKNETGHRDGKPQNEGEEVFFFPRRSRAWVGSPSPPDINSEPLIWSTLGRFWENTSPKGGKPNKGKASSRNGGGGSKILVLKNWVLRWCVREAGVLRQTRVNFPNTGKSLCLKKFELVFGNLF